jgi:hypothetical protein
MTRSEKLRDLAARVEALTAPSFALGVEVLRAFGRDIGDVNPLFSLDAALTLVPAGWAFHVATESRRPIAWASCTDPRGNCPMAIHAATPAVALTAAALRAQAEEAGHE